MAPMKSKDRDHARGIHGTISRRSILGFMPAALFLRGADFAQAVDPAKASETKLTKVRPLPLNAVRITGGPLKTSQDLDAKYLLALEPDRMLAYLRQRAGLESTAKPYGGWDGAGRQLTGHIAGHYLSAVSLMYAAKGDPQFKDRADYMVTQLKEIQDKQGDGYIGALMDLIKASFATGKYASPICRTELSAPVDLT